MGFGDTEMQRALCVGAIKAGWRALALLTLVGAALLSVPTLASAEGSTPQSYSLTPSTNEPYAACPPAKPGYAQCFSIDVPPGAVSGAGEALPMELDGSGELDGLSPADLADAYNLPAEGGGAGKTVAIVVAYRNKNIETDLKEFRETYGLPSCTKEGGCFRQMNQLGSEVLTELPKEDTSGFWGGEAALDTQMVSATCPECKIVLVEAESASLTNLFTAQQTAAALSGVTVISDSWGGEESSKQAENDKLFNNPGVPTVVAAGDIPHEAFYPATSPYAISVGGTKLEPAENARGWKETVWRDSSGGCSKYSAKPSWQSDWACPRRVDNDVAAVGASESPLAVYDNGWGLKAGTSAAAPIIAGIEARVSSTVRSEGPEAFYRHSLFDVTQGSAGACENLYLCTGGEGFDGPSGWGTPDGLLEATPGLQAITAESSIRTETAASLNGYVQAAGKETTYYFEYGPSSAYGQVSPAPNGSAGSGSVWKAESQSLKGLEKDQTYHYRLVASSNGKTVQGQDHTFQTVPWSVSSMAKPANTTDTTYESRINALACASTTACSAVGSYKNEKEEEVTLAERWNGSSWFLQTTKNPVGVNSPKLEGVSCPTTTVCTAVGNGRSASGETPVIELLSGEEWSTQSAPLPEGAKSARLTAVSCTTTSACTAVGSYKNSSGVEMPLAMRWNGASWSIQPTPNPAGSKGSNLLGVSCATTTACKAVGSYKPTEIEAALIESWNGSEWSLDTAAVPGESPGSKLQGVSCSSATACTAVGRHSVGTNKTTLVDRWNGTEWLAQELPSAIGSWESPLEPKIEELNAVSCSSPYQCIAVGHMKREGEITGTAFHWNGTSWALQGAPRPINAELFGVACPTVTSCFANGRARGPLDKLGLPHNVILGEAAAIPPIGKPKAETQPASQVTNDSGVLNANITAEGLQTTYYFEYGLKGYEYKSSEGAIEGLKAPVQRGLSVSGLVPGSQYRYRVVAQNAEGSNAGSEGTFTTPYWDKTALAEPAESSWAAARRVSCSTASDCMAVGDYETGAGTKAGMASRWSGSEWASTSPAVPGGSKSDALAGVSCTASNLCTAVGRYASSSGAELTLAERWNGSAWTIQTTPNPAGAKSSWLEDVACSSATACTAVGRYESAAGVEATLAERWNGTEWTLQTTVTPSGAKWSRFADVSCVSSVCSAVGSYESSGSVRLALVERWNGTEWTLQTAPAPAGSEWNSLKGVSCSTASECVAVGSYRSGGKYFTLAEVWNGTSWSLGQGPSATSGTLLDVSCQSGTWCEATGTKEGSEALAAHWDGSEWQSELTPGQPVGSVTALEGVSCKQTCTSVGYSNEAGKQPTALAESYPLHAPFLRTEQATSIEATKASLRATINPSGSETKYYFEYGPTTAYGTKTAEGKFGSYLFNESASKAVSGLTAGVTYHFRIVAVNALGTSLGTDRTFVPGTAEKLASLPTIEPFDGSSGSLASFASNWSALGWAGGSSPKGADTTTGWRAVDAFPTLNGAYYGTQLSDTGTGLAAAVAMAVSPGSKERSFSLWLDLSGSGSTRAGYQATFKETSTNTYEVTLSRWLAGTQEPLATASPYSFVNGNALALVDQGKTVSLWTNTGTAFKQVIAATDESYESGRAGLEASGNISRFTNFRFGKL
jgi:hypothetical protein